MRTLTRENQTSISIADGTKKLLNQFRAERHAHSLNEAILFLLRDAGYNIDGGRRK